MTVLRKSFKTDVMPQSQKLSAEAWGSRLGAGTAIIGSLLAMVGNLLHRVTPVGQSERVALAIAGSVGWIPIHLLIVAGLLLMFAGLVALCRSVRGGVAEALARYAHVAVIGGITVGVAAKPLADV